MHSARDPQPSRLPLLPPAALVPVLVLLGAVCGFARLAGWSGWSECGVLGLTGMVVAACIGTIWAMLRDRARVRRGIALGFLGLYAAMLVARLGGWHFQVETWAEPRFVWLSLGLAALGLGGLLGRRRWGRWLAIGLGAAGFGSAVLNGLGSAVGTGHALWLYTTYATGCALVACNLIGDGVAAEDRVGPDDALWNTASPVVNWLRAAIVSAFVAVPMLLVYAWLQPGRLDALVNPAIGLAFAIAICTALTVRGKVIGALGLVASGVGLLVLTGAGFAMASIPFEHNIALYYLVFWGPVSLCTIVAGTKLARPVWRALNPAPPDPQT